MQKEVMILVKDAKYYQDNQSLVIVGEEVETKKPITQQITVKAFLSNTKIFSPLEIETILNDPDRCRLFTNELKNRKHPFKLLFEDSKTESNGI